MKFAERIRALFGGGKKNEAFFDDIADLLVEGDLGAKLAFAVADELRASCRRQGIEDEEATLSPPAPPVLCSGRSTAFPLRL